MKKYVNWSIFAGVGVVLALASFMFNLWILPIIVDYQVGKTMALENGTYAWDMFIDTPVPVYINVYFFNVENPEGIARGEKPEVKEIGPYVYREVRNKHDINVNQENDTVFYHQGIKFTFDEMKSHPLVDSDKVVLINFAVHLISQVMESMPHPFDLVDEIVELGLPELLPEYGPTITSTVKDVLFNGVPIACNRKNSSTYANIICSSLRHFPKMKILRETEEGNFLGAILNFKNTSYNGLFEINRGVKDFTSIGKIVSWEHKKKTDSWSGDYCNNIVGSYDQGVLPPFLTKASRFHIFSTDICTTVPLEYHEEVEYRGIPSFRFKVSSKFLGNATQHPENACYDPGSIGGITNPGQRPLTGTIDLASCLNLPAVLSYPHFLNASPYYQSQINGLKPDVNKHETFLDLEPTTGVPMRAYVKFQINIFSRPSTALKILKDVKSSLFPVLWFSEGTELADAQLNMIRDQLLKVLHIANIIKWVLIGCGILMAIIGIIMAVIRIRQGHHHDD